jgi:hypothetical protein
MTSTDENDSRRRIAGGPLELATPWGRSRSVLAVYRAAERDPEPDDLRTCQRLTSPDILVPILVVVLRLYGAG